MRERLAALDPGAERVPIHTFHSLGLSLLRAHREAAGLAAGFRVAADSERISILAEALAISEARARALAARISRAKRTGEADAETGEALGAYRAGLHRCNAIDFDDLVGLAGDLLASRPDIAAACRERFRFVSVDEFQDVDAQQYRVLRLLCPADGNLCVIGDPDQAIYGFRGADAGCFDRFRQDFPTARQVVLKRNYRSSGTSVAASAQVMAPARTAGPAESVREMADRITVHVASSERAEAEFVVASIEALIGGHSFFSIDTGRSRAGQGAAISFGDIAVLYRTEAQAAPLREAFARSGMPFRTSATAPIGDSPAV